MAKHNTIIPQIAIKCLSPVITTESAMAVYCLQKLENYFPAQMARYHVNIKAELAWLVRIDQSAMPALSLKPYADRHFAWWLNLNLKLRFTLTVSWFDYHTLSLQTSRRPSARTGWSNDQESDLQETTHRHGPWPWHMRFETFFYICIRNDIHLQVLRTVSKCLRNRI